MNNNVNNDIQDYIEKRRNTQTAILKFSNNKEILDNDIDIFKYFDELKAQEQNDFDIKKILIYIRIIIKYHKKEPNFFTKIIEIISYLKPDIDTIMSNKEFFDFFSSNNKMLYHLFEKDLIKLEESILDILKEPSKIDYFEPVFEAHITNQPFDDYDEEMREKRKSGENDSQISKMIRNDYIDDFAEFISRTNYPLNSKIGNNYFETNQFLKEREPTLIEYACFYGSIQIFNFLRLNGVELTSSLWNYAIHSREADLIHLLESLKVEPEDKTYNSCIIEAIKCHHNDIANYLLEKTNQQRMKYILYYLLYENYEMISIDPDSYSYCDLTFEQILELFKYDQKFIDLLFTKSYFDINYKKDNETFLSYAIKENNIKLIEYLLSKPNIDPNVIISENERALTLAFEKGNKEIIKLLLQNQKIDPNFIYNDKHYKPFTILSMAIEKEDIELIKMLLECPNIDPNVKLSFSKNINEEEYIYEQKTALSMAVDKENKEIIDLLLKNPKIDPNITLLINYYLKDGYNHEMKNPLSMAIEKGNNDIIDLLLSNEKIIPNSKLYINEEEKTELSLAIDLKNKEIIQKLLQNQKVDPNFIFKQGTVLSKAIEEDNFELTKLLLNSPHINIYTKLEKKIEYHNETRSVNTILNLAIYKGNKDIIGLLFEYKKRSHKK